MRNTSLAQNFPGLAAVARITSRRRLRGGRAEKPFVRYYLLSRYFPAKRLLEIVRSHWAIENQLHWVLDVVFDEDAHRSRKDNAPENLAILRQFAINLLRSHPARNSMRQKSSAQGGTIPFFWSYLAICDSPARRAEGLGA